jgi:DNA-binding winged helix-turn-helix (wHTH) protein
MDQSHRRTFGPFELDLSTGELRHDGRIVPLQPQPARVLTTLVGRAGALVSRDHLREAVWGSSTHVDFDRGLNYCIRHLRAALGDDARRPRFIATVARQGYRFVAPVTSSQPVAPASRTNRPPRLRHRVALAALATMALVTFLVERGGRNQRHHEIAVAVVQAFHDAIF